MKTASNNGPNWFVSNNFEQENTMLNRRTFLMATGASLLPTASFASAAQADDQANDQALALLQNEIDTRESAGIVAGIITGGAQRIVAAGRSDAPDGALDGDTVFEIASLTKLFTALLLADMVQHGEVALDDPAAKYLPPHVAMPDFEGRGITLRDLVTYTAGLPAFPADFPALDKAKPFPNYPIDQMYAALGATKLPYAPGEHYRYGNFGYGLLGHVLSRCAGMRYEDLVVQRICAPLGMDSTRISLTPSMQARRAPGHSDNLKMVASWHQPPAFEAASAFSSTVNDMLKFLAAAMGQRPSGLAPAFAALLEPRRLMKSKTFPDMSVAAGWFIHADHDDELIWKNGDTLGFTSFMGYSAKSQTGVVLLANGECGGILTPLGWHLINADFPLKKLD